MSRKTDDDSLWPMVMVPKREWDALVRFFRQGEKILASSWHPKDHKIYEAARLAASRKFKVNKKRGNL